MSERRPSLQTWLPWLAVIALVAWAWHRLEFFTRSALVVTMDGTVERWPNALATVDHPFHAARFSIFLDSVRNGGTPRWVFQHQGGYPSEFYPFGSAVVDLFVWAISFGQASIPMIHTWAVALVFTLPVIGFMAIPRLARLSPWIGVAAAGGHVCVRGWWWSGGSYELIEWGLVTNVLAAALVFLVLVCMAGLIDGRSPRLIALVALLIGWAIWTNPRSAIALVAVALAVVCVVFVEWDERPDWKSALPLALPLLIGVGLAAPLIASLVRYNELYFFVHYSGYSGVGAWLDSSIQAVSGPVFLLAMLGLALGFLIPGSVAERLIAWTTLNYLAMTWWLVEVQWPGGWVEQLETTRLMPFQRLLMIALACTALGRIAELVSARARPYAVAGLAAIVPVLYVMAPPSFIPDGDRGMVRIGTMADPGIADLRSAIAVADQEAAPGTALLILGTTAYWHDHMWAKLWTDRLLYYDDWLWYWQREHVGFYDPETEHAYPDDASALDPAYLRTHGIGAVIVTGAASGAAAESPDLRLMREGTYQVFAVNDYRTTATVDEQATAVEIGENRIVVGSIPPTGGPLVVRVNWFPRWQASGGGQELSITHRGDGYIEIQVPPGVESVELRYGRTVLDWFVLALAGISALVVLATLIRPTRWLAPVRRT